MKIQAYIYLFLAGIVSVGLIFLCFIMGNLVSIIDDFEFLDGIMICLLGGVCLVLLGLTFYLFQEAYIRICCEAIEKTLTVSAAKMRTETNVVMTYSNNMTIPHTITSRNTDIQFLEFPNQVFTRSGHYDYKYGEKVALTFYVRANEILSYDF